jgi:hypothetical protein
VCNAQGGLKTEVINPCKIGIPQVIASAGPDSSIDRSKETVGLNTFQGDDIRQVLQKSKRTAVGLLIGNDLSPSPGDWVPVGMSIDHQDRVQELSGGLGTSECIHENYW